MAKQEHLDILKQGVEVWNKWRKENPDIEPDLSKAHLYGAYLSGADLREADLGEADLSKADLRKANLYRAYLGDADLSHADLRSANLNSTELHGAYLNDADLSTAILLFAEMHYTDLTSTNLKRADLMGTSFHMAALDNSDLTEARLDETIFTNIDFSKVIGLETCSHYGPSTLDHQTLEKSKNLPEKFLRGVGLSDEFIEFYHQLHTTAIDYYSCFISYSSKDDEFAKRLHADLQDNGLRCWFAPEDLKIGEKIRHGIDMAIRFHDKLLLIISKDSIDSDWVENEVETALEKERESKEEKTVLFPIMLDDAVMKTKNPWAGTIRRTRHIGDFTDWKNHDSYQKAFERLLKDLKKG